METWKNKGEISSLYSIQTKKCNICFQKQFTSTSVLKFLYKKCFSHFIYFLAMKKFDKNFFKHSRYFFEITEA